MISLKNNKFKNVIKVYSPFKKKKWKIQIFKKIWKLIMQKNKFLRKKLMLKIILKEIILKYHRT